MSAPATLAGNKAPRTQILGTSHLLVCDGNKHELLGDGGETLPEGKLGPDQFPRPVVCQPVAYSDLPSTSGRVAYTDSYTRTCGR